MKSLFENGTVINVFTGETYKANVLVDDNKIVGVGDYTEKDADITNDVTGKYICPGFIDGHIHIESTLMLPHEFVKAALPHGTTAIVADPHEIANVCGTDGIDFMLEDSTGLPMDIYFVIPSCVPATPFDEAGAVLQAENIKHFYSNKRVLGLGEVMNYVGVINDNKQILEKITDVIKCGKIANGHAPMLYGKSSDKYIAAGITDDHECVDSAEAIDKLKKGQFIMIREGTAARNLKPLLPLFDAPYNHRCMLVTDDKHPNDLINNGHIDDIIRKSVELGKDPITGIKMATIQAAQYYGLKNKGAIAPGYFADMLILDDIDTVKVYSVYKDGKLVACDGKALDFELPEIKNKLREEIIHSIHINEINADDFKVYADSTHNCNIISVVPGQLITENLLEKVDFDLNNGIDIDRDILKIAVIERHKNTGHIGLGFIKGIGIKKGAIASSVSHDSHNIIVVGTNEDDMAYAVNKIREIGGGSVVIESNKTIAQMPLPYAGLMSDESAQKLSQMNDNVRNSVYNDLGASDLVEPFMIMNFVSLPVIPHIKLTTKGLIDVDIQKIVPLIVD